MTKSAEQTNTRVACHGPFTCKDCGASPSKPPNCFGEYPNVVVESNNGDSLTSPPPPRSPDPATGTKRDKKEFSQRQLQLPQKQFMSCRHCNEAEKDEAKAERRKSLDESRELKTGEVINKGRQVHNNFKSMSRVA